MSPFTPTPPPRQPRGPRDVRETGPFVSLARQARKRDELDRRLRGSLPAPLREQVRLADLHHGRLVFLAPSPAWAARLRTYQAQVLAAAHAQGVEADAVVVKVAPPHTVPTPEPPRRTPLSRATATHLRAAARSLVDHKLRDLFLELASIAESSDSPADRD